MPKPVDFTVTVELRCTMKQLAEIARWIDEHPDKESDWPEIRGAIEDRMRQPVSLYIPLPTAADLPNWAQALMREEIDL